MIIFNKYNDLKTDYFHGTCYCFYLLATFFLKTGWDQPHFHLNKQTNVGEGQ